CSIISAHCHTLNSLRLSSSGPKARCPPTTANTSRSAIKDFQRQGPGRCSQRRRRAGLSSTTWRVVGSGGGVANGGVGTGLISTAVA
ncbi:hypothetical protein HN873_027470, partial [Arachis hypogaea]